VWQNFILSRYQYPLTSHSFGTQPSKFAGEGVLLRNYMNLPKSMAERALWARNEFIQNPKNSQTDNDNLIWCYKIDDNLWYSINGNYSHSSPKEKFLKEIEREKRTQELNDKYEEERIKKEKEIEYWSNIRQKILERDNYTCQICFQNANTKLHIHHILKKRQKGEDYYDNLITVCPPCHSQADRKLYNPKWK
jgi:hypothetical protein